jgi:uncharacterized protein (DUF885 family)
MTHPTDPASALRALADEFWEGFLAHEPTWATIIGDRRFDDRVEDRSPEGIAAFETFLRAVAARAEAMDPASLGPRDRVTRRMLIDTTTGHADHLATGIHEWNLSPLAGPQVTFVDLADYQPIGSVAEGRALVARWRAVGPLVDQIVADLQRGLAGGRVSARKNAERTLATLDTLLAAAPEDWGMAAPAREPHDDWPAADLAAFRADLVAAIRDVVIPAFARFRDAVRDEILPASRPDERPGLCHVPGGLEAYAATIRYHTDLALDPAEVHATGLREVARIDAEFVALGRRVLGTSDLASTLAALRGDPALHFSTAQEVFDTAERSLRRAEAAVPAWFGRLPKAACEVVPIPEETAPNQTIAYYAWPAMDGSRPGRYYINLYDPTSRPRYEAECLAFHEAVPGHHLQLAIAQELDGLPAFQRALGSTAYAEGWGLYTERLCDEMGLYSGDLDRFGVLSFDAWRACRLVVDTGLHAFGWTRDQAIAFMREHTALDDFNIPNEVDRYVGEPAQALAYKTGQLEILRLRAGARDRLGERFDIRAFHDTILGSGAVGLPTLAELVEDWVTGVEAGA